MKNIQSDYSVYILFKSLKGCSAKSQNICCCSVSHSCPTLWEPMDCSIPGFPVLHHLPEFAQTHVQISNSWVCSNSCLNSEGEVVVPEVCGQSSSQTHGVDRRKYFPSFFLVYLGSFPPHSHCGLSLERVMSPFCSVTCGQTLYLLCQKGHTVPALHLPFLSLLCHLGYCQFQHHTPCLAAPSMVQSINCKSTDGEIFQVSWYAVQRCFVLFLTWMSISCELTEG